MNTLTGVTDGQLYDANYDDALITLRKRIKTLCIDYNQTRPYDNLRRLSLLKSILGSAGTNTHIEPPFFCDYGSNISVGDNFYANHGLVILDGTQVTIGNNVFIGPAVGIHTAGHPLDAKRRNQGLEYALPITLEDNVWIGASSVILPGVTIGRNSVIGAGSVVTRNIPADVVAVGNPCRVLRKITSRDGEQLAWGTQSSN